MDEEIIDIKDLKGKVIIVNFWATWCPPCRREMSSLEDLYQVTANKGVDVIAVNIGEDPDAVFPFLGNLEAYPSFQIVFDTEAVLMDQWKVQGLPTTFIVNKDGKVIYKAVGGREFNHPSIRQKIQELTK
ncbi:MAG: TlpA family protein disulfide reductase [Gammaproteobacteria bacterium]|nr:TlpA family protein disulfide reductase [Gammaproteobacteria bacterium]